jgi:hypothetical protein
VMTAWEYPSFYGWAPANPGETDFAQLSGQAQPVTIVRPK